jgi:hypothetical protein
MPARRVLSRPRTGPRARVRRRFPIAVDVAPAALAPDCMSAGAPGAVALKPGLAGDGRHVLLLSASDEVKPRSVQDEKLFSFERAVALTSQPRRMTPGPTTRPTAPPRRRRLTGEVAVRTDIRPPYTRAGVRVGLSREQTFAAIASYGWSGALRPPAGTEKRLNGLADALVPVPSEGAWRSRTLRIASFVVTNVILITS